MKNKPVTSKEIEKKFEIIKGIGGDCNFTRSSVFTDIYGKVLSQQRR